jgi:phosphotransferase system HPr (HPr) family protein
MAEIKLTVHHEVGLHARPAALFVQKSSRYKSIIRVRYLETEVNAKSILSVLTLGVHCGGEITIFAEGEDADLAIRDLADLIEGNFGEAK